MHIMNTRLINLLSATSTALYDVMNTAVVEASGLGESDAAAMMMAAQWPGGTLQSFVGALRLSQPATVRLFDRLEKERLVERREGERGHVVSIHPTPQGKKLVEKMLQARAKALDKLLSDLSSQDRDALERFATSVLSKATTSGAVGDRICRLCSDRDCPTKTCPVFACQKADSKYILQGWTKI